MTGFRIRPLRDRIDAGLVDRFCGLPVANVSDGTQRMAAGSCSPRPMHRSGPLAGPGLTVRTRPGDNLMVHKAIDMAAAPPIGAGSMTGCISCNALSSSAWFTAPASGHALGSGRGHALPAR